MKIQLHGENDLSLSDFESPTFEVDADPGAEPMYSALEIFITSLGLCTASVLMGYAEGIEVSTEGLGIHVTWEYTDDPYRVAWIDMAIHWPALPESRLEAARRAAARCTIHNTLHHPPEVKTKVFAEPAR